MRFIFVDKITEIKKGKHIKGVKTVSFEECFLKSLYEDDGYFPRLLILEAVAQLASWLIIFSTDFVYKPLLVKAERVEVSDNIKCGTSLILEAEIILCNEDGAVINGRVKKDGKVIAKGDYCLCKYFPLEKLDDIENVKDQFKELTEKAAIF